MPFTYRPHGNNNNAMNSSKLWRPITSSGWLLALPQSSDIFWSNAYVWHDFDCAAHGIKEHYESLRNRSAIEKIAGSLKAGGWVIASEKASVINFQPFFEQAGLSVVTTTGFKRGDVGTGRRRTLYKSQYIRYVCTKL
jgi:hypothetical protein